MSDTGPFTGADGPAIKLARRRIANGGWEWFFAVGRTPLYPGGSGSVGVFTSHEVTHGEAFMRVMRQWFNAMTTHPG